MNYGRIAIPLVFLSLVCPSVAAQTNANMNSAGYCIGEPTAAIPAVIPAGYVQYCIILGSAGRIGDTVYIGAKISGPAPIGAPVSTIGYSLVGCSAVGGPTVRNNLAALNLATTSFQPVNVTDTTCTGAIRFQVAVGGTAIIDQQLPFAFSVRDDVTATMSFLCNNTGSAASAYSPTSTSCTTPDVNVPDIATEIDQLRVDLCDNPSGHGHCMLDIHGGLDIAQDGNWNITGDLGLTGNFTSNNTFPSNLNVTVSGNLNSTVTGDLNSTTNINGSFSFPSDLNVTVSGSLNETGGNDSSQTESSFQQITETKGDEFLVLIFVVLTAIVIWLRAVDLLVKFAMGLLPFIPSVIWIYLAIVGGWPGNVALAVFAGGVGFYMMIRTGIDEFNLRKGGTPR